MWGKGLLESVLHLELGSADHSAGFGLAGIGSFQNLQTECLFADIDTIVLKQGSHELKVPKVVVVAVVPEREL